MVQAIVGDCMAQGVIIGATNRSLPGKNNTLCFSPALIATPDHIDQMTDAMVGLLDPETRETIIGHAEVKEVFKLSVGVVAGCLVTDGRMDKNARARVLRDGQPVFDGNVATLKRFQDDVKEVKTGLECGIRIAKYTEYLKGDVIECYLLENLEVKL